MKKTTVFIIVLLLMITSIKSFAQNREAANESVPIISATMSKLRSHESLKANIRMDITLDGEEYATQGKYVEEEATITSGDDLSRSRFRLDLNFPLSSSESLGKGLNKMTVICDKEIVWQYISIENNTWLNKIDINKVLDAIKKSPKKSKFSTVGGITGLGGLGGLVRSIRDNYVFTNEPVDFLLKGKTPLKVWKISGTMQPDLRGRLETELGKTKEQTIFPSHLPTDVEIYVGQDDDFPYRVHYYNTPDPNHPQTRTSITQLVFFDVLINDGTIPSYLFKSSFDQNNTSGQNDITDDFIKSLGL
ncbi:MAG: hypothetical protein LBU65_09845 [Planctomycetaceae bacterium]|jgi:hypothetical protein|nr:hypothetical protein [Planctomycetaceae bacterium]